MEDSDELVEMGTLPSIQSVIDRAMEAPDTDFAGLDSTQVKAVLENKDFRAYQQDQIYRWVIRNFLVSASVNGQLPEEKMSSFLAQAGSPAGRERLAAALMYMPVAYADEIPDMTPVDVQEYPKS